MNKKATRARKTKRPLTEKEKRFCKEYVKTGNGTQTALKVYDTNGEKSAGAIASENLAKPRIREEIAKLMRDNDVELSDVLNIHKRNMLQDEHLPTSQKAVSDFYDILGIKETKANTGVQIAFIVEK